MVPSCLCRQGKELKCLRNILIVLCMKQNINHRHDQRSHLGFLHLSQF